MFSPACFPVFALAAFTPFAFLILSSVVTDAAFAAFLKEKPDGTFKISLRSKSYADVNAVARMFDGGGHLRASGGTLRGVTVEEAVKLLQPAMEKAVAQSGDPA